MILILFFYYQFAAAAPIPATSSSALISEKPGMFYSTHGFQMHAANTAWIQMPPPKKIPALVTIYKSPLVVDGQQPALTVRVDQLRQNLSLKPYVKKYMQDYSRFGFDVITAKAVRINDASAFWLDIVSHESKKQLVQVVFLKEKTAVILTCRDQRETFAKTVQDCGQIIRTFRWNAGHLNSTAE